MIGELARYVRMRVARRLFVFFVIAAFVPLAALALLSLHQVRSLLLQQGEQRLSSHARDYGMAFFDRLNVATDVGVAAALHPQSPAPNELARRAFYWVAQISDGRVAHVFGEPRMAPLDGAERARLAAGKPQIVVTPDPLSRVILLAPVDPQGTRVMAGEIRPAFLWGPSDELPVATEICVVQAVSFRLLYCSEPMGAGAMRAAEEAAHASFGSARWNRDGTWLLSRAWSQFMRAGFATDDWVVIASQPEDYQLRRAIEFSALYVPVVLLALLLVTWFTIRQSRDIVTPVTRLAERARGIAGNDFSTRLALEREDEFGELANAFDQMSHRLGRQFASLRAFSQVDRLILTTQDTTQIVRTVLHGAGDILACDMVTVTLYDNESPNLARSYFRPRDAKDSLSMLRHAVTREERAELDRDAAPRMASLAGEVELPFYLRHLEAEGYRTAYIQPIAWRGEVCGAMVLAYLGEGEPAEDEKRQVAELADRIAVAVSAAWRDEQLYQQAHYDTLTGMPNRLLFKDRLDREIARSQREGVSFAVLFVDLDHFKNVNDSFGHSVGDEVLRETARRIGRCVRNTDTVGRLGGDEFTVLVTRLANPQEALLIAETIVGALSEEYVVDEHRCFLSASIGIASYPGDSRSAEGLLASADTAMYRAKGKGRSQAMFFEERMNAEAVARLTLDRDLRAAIEGDELELHYQPQVELRTGAIRSVEALVRWHHPVHGWIAPLRFIPLAEESGFIESLGQWVIERACRQLRDWRAAGVPIERIAVNVSPRQFRRRTLATFMSACVTQMSIPPSSLEVEVTEGLLVERGEEVEGLLQELASAGHPIALDDFGTGFSSMAYLQRLPVHTIKIDRVFIEGLERGGESLAIVEAIVAMSHALGKSVIAEGVETPEQVEILRRLRCDEIQGFVVSAARPADDLVRFLEGFAGAKQPAREGQLLS